MMYDLVENWNHMDQFDFDNDPCGEACWSQDDGDASGSLRDDGTDSVCYGSVYSDEGIVNIPRARDWCFSWDSFYRYNRSWSFVHDELFDLMDVWRTVTVLRSDRRVTVNWDANSRPDGWDLARECVSRDFRGW